MSPSLPTRPNLDHLKKQAKCLLRAHRVGNTQACRPLREHLPRLQGKSDDEILAARITLHDAQYAIAREHGFEHWPALRKAVLESSDPYAAGATSAPVPTMGRINERSRRHIEALGFATVGSYRIWCHSQGLSTAVDKSEEQLRQELKRRRQHPPAPEPAPVYRPSQARLLTRAYHGDEGIWNGWKRPYEGVADDAERAALHRLLIHCERYARVSGPFVWQLARHRRDWLRPVEEWFPTSQNPRQQLRELTRHLLGRDDLPSLAQPPGDPGPTPSVWYEQARTRHNGRTVLTPAQVASFEDLGYVHVPEAFPCAAAAQMHDFMWSELERLHGCRRSDPSTWTRTGRDPSQWTGLGLNRSKDDPVYRGIAAPRMMQAIEELIGPDAAACKQSWGAFLVTFPEPANRQWDVPHRWAFYAGPQNGLNSRLNVYTYYSQVGPRGGAPLIVERSHRLITRFLMALSRDEMTRKTRWLNSRFIARYPWFAELSGRAADRGDRVRRFMAETAAVDGVDVRVVELTGKPGDAVLCHAAIMGAWPLNCSDKPAFVRG